MVVPAEINRPAQTPPAPGRLHFIDGLRGLAMLMVLLFHCAFYSDHWRAPGHLLAFVNYGHIGVNLFLVLSGFCLYWPFVKPSPSPAPTLWQFAKKRGRRILPPYYAALAFFWLFLVWDTLTGHRWHADATDLGHAVRSLLWHLTMLYNLRPEYVLSINGPFWSLALEFSLYLLFPVLVALFGRAGAAPATLGVLAVCLAYRAALVQAAPASLLTGEECFVLYDSLPGRCFEFAAGMCAARWVSAPVRSRLPAGLLLLSGTGAVYFTETGGTFSLLSDPLWGVCFAALIVAAGRPQSRLSAALSRPWLVRLGTISYSVYLVHQPLVKALDSLALRWHLWPVLFGLLVIVPAALSLGYLFHLCFEKPFLSSPKPKSPPDESAAVTQVAATPGALHLRP